MPSSGEEAVDEVIKKANATLYEIKLLNKRIPNQPFTQKVAHTVSLAETLLHIVVQQPEKLEKITRFLDYYLPTIAKMVKHYHEIEVHRVQGENALLTKTRIREGMDIVNTAFTKQLDEMYGEDAMDISSDIDVLEAMLKQDGLIDETEGGEGWKGINR